MKKKGAIWIDRTLIELPFCVGLCQSEAQFRHELKRLKVTDCEADWIAPDKDANVLEFEHSDTAEKCIIVSIRAKKETSYLEVIGLLVHEVVHVWQTIRQSMGEKEPSSEFEAYCIQRIAQNLVDAYKIK